MAHRTFRDLAGAEWHAWDTYPSGGAGRAGVSAEFAGGWLSFERVPPAATSAGAGTAPEKRRLAPVPARWADLPEATLHRLLAAARAVAPAQRHRPAAGAIPTRGRAAP